MESSNTSAEAGAVGLSAPASMAEDDNLLVVDPVTEHRAKAQRVLAAWIGTKRGTSQTTYIAGLGDFAAFVGADDLVAVVAGLLAADVGEFIEVTDLYRAHLVARGLAAATRKRLLLTLQSVGRKAFRMGMIDWEPRLDDLPTPRGVRDTSGPPVEKIAAVLRHVALADDRFAVRDRV